MSQVVEIPRVRTIHGFDEFEDVRFDEPLVHTYTQTKTARSVPGLALGGAVFTWMMGIFALCYVTLPVMLSALGLQTLDLVNLLLNTLAFLPMAVITALLAAVVKPTVVLHPGAKRDPVIAASLGSLLVWFAAHQGHAALQPLTTMWGPEAFSFLAVNVVEAGLIGMMLGSFAKTTGRAFVLGALFQIVLTALFLGWIV